MGFVEAVMLRNNYVARLREYFEKHPPAWETNSKECNKCGLCCLTRPGGLNKEDVERIAKHLKISVKEFVQDYCVADAISSHELNDGIFILLLRRKHQEGNTLISWRESHSVKTSCVFFIDGDCKIHEIKPHQCASLRCWEEKEEEGKGSARWTRDELKAVGYTGEFEDYEEDW